MTPYVDFLYFGILLYVVIPTLLLGVAGHASARWALLATLAMLAVQYGGFVHIDATTAVREIWIVGAYALFEWAVAVAFLRRRARGRERSSFYTALVLALLPLLVAKYVPALAPGFQIGFLGISYVTFRSLDVIFGVQDRAITTLPAGQFLAYLFFFATISAGPIDRYRRFESDWGRRRTRAEFLGDVDEAVHRIFIGFLYKFIIAALVKRYWLDPLEASAGFANTVSYMYAYSIHLFFDFAGYSAFAIGVSYLFGIHTPDNFNRPFLAQNIRDFWNRWHITLSWWLRDHVYMRFMMAALKGRWFKNKYVASALGLFLAFGLMGLWHGTAPHYLLYGLYHGALLSSHEAFSRWNKRHQLWGDGPLWRIAGVVGTFHCVCFGFLLFSGRLTNGAARRVDVGAGAPAYEGRYEKAACGEIGGWVWDATHPQTPVAVDIYADEAKVATVTADLFRQDLAESGKGSGAHAFIFVPPPSLKDSRPHSIEARVAGTDIRVGDQPRTIVCGMTVESMDGYEGALDRMTCARISGWTRDTTEPDRTIDVDVYDGSTLIATVAAGALRDTSSDRDRGHGFEYIPSAALADGQPHSISVHIAGTNVALRNAPQVLTCRPGSTEPAIAVEPAEVTPTAPPGHAAPHAYTDNGDGTITDLTTGLVWEKKIELDDAVDAANPHDADNCYPWAGTCAGSGAECRRDADCGDNGSCLADDCQTAAPNGLTIFNWVARLNTERFAGHDDWRLPTSQELYGIVNPIEENEPAATAAFKGRSCGSGCADMKAAACSCTHPGLYWAAPESAPSPDESWMMFFYCNGNLFLDLKSNKFHVRAVRGAS